MSQQQREDERFDALLLSLAQNITAAKGAGIDPILDTFFSFLRRKTDFFTGADQARLRSKLDEHVNKQLRLAKESEESSSRAQKEREAKAKQQEAELKAKQQATALKTTSGAESKVSIQMVEVERTPAAPVAAAAASSKTVAQEAPTKTAVTKKNDGEEEEETEEEKGKLRPNEGNGADLDSYSWTQTLREANIQIPVPSGTASKQVIWDISRTHMTVGVKGAAKPVLKGKLFADVRPDECHWTLEDLKGVRTLCVHLDKVSEMQWWDKIVEGEPSINTKKVQPENSKLSDLDGETRQVVEKMMFDQRQKAMGKPSSEEMKKMEMLEKLQKANPNLDFSKVKMDGGSGFSGFSS